MKLTKIQIDLDVYKMIEAERLDFAENHNDILRRKYVSGTPATTQIGIAASDNVGARVTGKFSFTYNSEQFSEGSLKAAYKKCLLLITDDFPSFLARLSEKETPARRIVSQDPKKLYKSSPHLADEHAEKLNDTYWYDTNLSTQQTISRLRTACEVAGITFGTTLALQF
tara:strand:- start:92 stop:598 length:507 start_codon:yes stop_codon:yes gene_type:complete